MLHHGISPEGMLNGTMVPIPKGRCEHLTTSDNFRAITLSSIFGTLIDMIAMNKENEYLLVAFNLVSNQAHPPVYALL